MIAIDLRLVFGVCRPCLCLSVAFGFLSEGFSADLRDMGKGTPATPLLAATDSGANGNQPVALSESSESSGLDLARQHLPELVPVLEYLRSKEPDRYRKAILDLDRAVKRLELQRRRGQAFFDVALRQWQARGKIDLIKARLKVRPTAKDRDSLLVEMSRVREIELERLELERESVRQRERIASQRLTQAAQVVDRLKQQARELDLAIDNLTHRELEDHSSDHFDVVGRGLSSDDRPKAKGQNAQQIK